MLMSKKSYDLIASEIATVVKELDPQGREGVVQVVRGLCRALKCDNPKFRSDLFITACGLTIDEVIS